MPDSKLMIITTVTAADVDAVLDAISEVGGGTIGDYTHCAFTNNGLGRFKPSATSQPHVGDVGTINQEPEVRIETFCPRAIGKQVVAAIRAAHPYEEPVIYIVPVLDEADL